MGHCLTRLASLIQASLQSYFGWSALKKKKYNEYKLRDYFVVCWWKSGRTMEDVGDTNVAAGEVEPLKERWLSI